MLAKGLVVRRRRPARLRLVGRGQPRVHRHGPARQGRPARLRRLGPAAGRPPDPGRRPRRPRPRRDPRPARRPPRRAGGERRPAMSPYTISASRRLDRGRLDHAPPRLDRRRGRPGRRRVAPAPPPGTAGGPPRSGGRLPAGPDGRARHPLRLALPARSRDGAGPRAGRSRVARPGGRTTGDAATSPDSTCRAPDVAPTRGGAARSRSPPGSSRWSATCPASGCPARW